MVSGVQLVNCRDPQDGDNTVHHQTWDSPLGDSSGKSEARALSRGRHYRRFGSVQMVPDMLPILTD
jgi:hypothetical protein